jgi:hypothetical protein
MNRLLVLTLVMAAVASTASAKGLDDFHWLVGEWVEVKAGVTTRETWTGPKDGALTGVGETIAAGRPTSTEHMKITIEPAGPTFTALLAGQPPTPFVLVPGKPRQAVFENKAHDFPQRVIYRACGADLCARIEGRMGGKSHAESWRYRRVK